MHITGMARREAAWPGRVGCLNPLSFSVSRDMRYAGQSSMKVCIPLQPSLDLSIPRRGRIVMCLAWDYYCCYYNSVTLDTIIWIR